MNRFFIFLFITLAFAFGCTSTTSEQEAESNDQEEHVDTDADHMGDMGNSFEVTTLNDTIASPRRQMTAIIDGVEVIVTYGSPSVKERTIWGELVPYDVVWRTGANEATTFSVNQAIMVAGQELPAGTYGLFTIPGESDWTIIFNETAEQWGAYEYDESKDVLRVKVSPEMSEEASETMEFGVSGNDVIIMWENVAVPFTIEAA